MAALMDLFGDISESFPEEQILLLIERPGLRIERIVSHGHASPAGFWYDQPQAEFVVLLRGAARLRFDDGICDMKPGSCINIPSHCRHRVEWTDPEQPTVWLAVHYES